MKIDKCRNCKHYHSSFNGCVLYYRAIYVPEGIRLGDGVLNIRPVNIKSVSEPECEYEVENDR